MKLGKLPARLATVNTQRIKTLEAKAGTTPRIRGNPWMVIRHQVLVRDGYACQCCGIVRRDNEVDHRTPLEQGGSNDTDNLQTLCGGPDGCHARKTASEAKARSGR